MLHLLWRCPWVKHRDVGIVLLQGTVDVYYTCIAHIGTILLKGEAHDDYLRAQHLYAFLQHQLYGLVGYVSAHAVVHAAPGKDNLGVVPQSLCALGQVVGVHRYAVATNKAWVHLYEVPLGASGFQHVLGVYAHQGENLRQFVDKGNVDVSLAVLDNFGSFGHLDARCLVGTVYEHSIVHFVY